MTKQKNKAKEPEQGQRDLQRELDALREAQETLQGERDELFEKLQRIGADYANYQKRVPKQVADSVAYEKEKILKSLLPALDGFDHALQNAEKADNVGAITAGIRMVYDQMLDILKSHGVTVIDATDHAFDPARHEAMLRQSDPEREDNVVLQEFLKGYALYDRVLRPSKVIVNKVETSVPAASDAETEPMTEETTDPEV